MGVDLAEICDRKLHCLNHMTNSLPANQSANHRMSVKDWKNHPKYHF